MYKISIPVLALICTCLSGCLQIPENIYAPQTQQVAPPSTIAERVTLSLMDDFGFERHQAAGIAGNLAQESGQFMTLAEVNGTCYGYSQWCGSRKSEFLRFAKNNGGKASFDANYGFLRLEMSRDYPDMIERIKRTDTVAASAEIFMRVFLRPHKDFANLPRRIRFGQHYNSGDFSRSACATSPTSKPATCKGAKTEVEQINSTTFRIHTL
jgi:hypothetical protein